jgi:hypothetical protein
VLSAQNGNGVTVSNLAVDGGTVTFDVNWKNTGMPAVWSDSVWVFVDYNNNGTMWRLPLMANATLTATSAPGVGKVIEVPNNNKGVWVVGNARSTGSFSATVKLLTSQTGVAGACAYASNYPPVGEYKTTTQLAFTGTPPFDLVLNTGVISVQGAYELLGSQTLLSFSDKTGAPGIIKCMPMAGNIEFSVPAIVSKNQPASFVVSKGPDVPSSAVAYNWSAPGFVPEAYTGTPFNPAAPASASTYQVTLTARSEGYCDLVVTKDVDVLDCVNPVVQTLLVSASSFCAGSDAGVTFALPGTQAGAKYQLYRDGSTPVGNELDGTGDAATFTGGPFNVVGTYTAKSVTSGQYCALAMSGEHEVSAVPLPAPTVVDATFCFGLPGQLQAVAPNGATIAWYDAPTAGNLLYAGNVLPLTPLYNDAAPYYAESNTADHCVSAARMQANYLVKNCALGTDCPDYTAGSVGANTTPAACGSFYPGQIGATDYPATCVVFDAGRIGKSQ